MAEWVECSASILIDQGFEPHGFKPRSSQINDIQIDTCRYLQYRGNKDWHGRRPGETRPIIMPHNANTPSLSSPVTRSLPSSSTASMTYGSVAWFLELYNLATSKDISGWGPTSDSAHSWQLYSTAPLGNQATGTMTHIPLSHIILTLSYPLPGLFK